MLKQGTTAAALLEAAGFSPKTQISIPGLAKKLGFTLEKFKEGGVTKYKGTPMGLTEKEEAESKATLAEMQATKTAALVAKVKKEEAEAKAAALKAEEEAKAKAAAEIAAILPATPQELEKAKKTIPLQLQYVPDHPKTVAGQTEAQKLIDEFNKNYVDKPMTTQAMLEDKVTAFKVMAFKVQAITKIEHAQQAELLAKQAVAQKEAQAAAATELQKAKVAAAAKNKGYMDSLGISETEAVGFGALVKMMGGSDADVVEQFKSYAKQAESLGYPISGFQYALIRNYINGGYSQVNEKLRSGSFDAQTHVYARLVNHAIDKMPKYTGEVLRGTHLSPQQVAKYQPGNVIKEDAFTSTGVGFKFGGNVAFKIKAIGKRGGDFSKGANTGEKEVLFKANTFFIVHSVKTAGSTTHIEMEEVEGHG